jgi:hypothetical protein
MIYYDVLDDLVCFGMFWNVLDVLDMALYGMVLYGLGRCCDVL